ASISARSWRPAHASRPPSSHRLPRWWRPATAWSSTSAWRPPETESGGDVLDRHIIEDRSEPALDLADRHALAACIVLHLVALDLGDAEIITFRRSDVEAGDRGARPHGKALRQPHVDGPLRVEQAEKGFLFGVVGLGRVARRRADTGIGFADEVGRREALVRCVAPELLAHIFVHPFRERLGEAVGQRLDEDRGIIVVRPLETLGDGDLADARR